MYYTKRGHELILSQIDSVTKEPNRNARYYRFGLPPELSTIQITKFDNLDIHEAIEIVEALMKEYLALDETDRHLKKSAQLLVEKRHGRGITGCFRCA